MRKKLIEKIKPEVLQAVKDNSFLTSEFNLKCFHWYVHNEKLSSIYNCLAVNRVYNLLSQGYNFNLSDEMKKDFFVDAIAHLTSNLPYFRKLKFFNTMKKSQIVQRYKRTKKGYIITNSEGKEIEIDLLSKYKQVAKVFPMAKNFYDRTGRCHEFSIALSQLWSNENVKVAIGNVTRGRNNYNFTHSWVEIVGDNGKEAVMDLSLNAIFKKEDYYKLFNAEPLNFVSKDKLHELIRQDYFRKGGYIQEFDLKFLLLYYDEIIDIIKNLPPEQLAANKDTKHPQRGE